MDTNLKFRAASAGNLIADETGAYKEIGPMVNPMVLCVHVPTASASDTLDITMNFSDDGSTALEKLTMPQITAKGFFTMGFYSRRKYASVDPNVTGVDVNFGAVEIYPAPAGAYNQN